MDVASMLATARDLHTLAMVDTCAITRHTPGDVLDPDTGLYPTTEEPIYTGPCRIKPAATTTVDAASIAVDAARPILDLPWSADPIAAPGDLVTITTGPLAGRTAEIVDEIASTTGTSRRYTIELVTR